MFKHNPLAVARPPLKCYFPIQNTMGGERSSLSKLIVIEHLTLDGVMQGPGRPDEDTRGGFTHGGWGALHNDPAMMTAQAEQIGKTWSLLLGRRTYEDFAGFWPRQPQPNPFTDALNRVQKYVASTTLEEPLTWENTSLLREDAATSVARLKQERDDTLIIFGSGVLVQPLARASLIDTYLLMIHPIIFGTGHRLFSEGTLNQTLTLSSSTTTPSGVLIATYTPA